MACHQAKHEGQGGAHVAVADVPTDPDPADTCGDAASGCHQTNNVAAVHAGGPGGGCTLCHGRDTIPATTDCLVCHPGVGTDHHEQHNTAGYIPDGCEGCHFTYLDDEHEALGYSCATCHESTSQAVLDAIAADQRACVACHPGNHYDLTQRWYEFNPNNGSAHRVTPDLPGMRDSFVVDGTAYSWTRPGLSRFLKTGWTYDSMVLCSDCHSYSGATGPHGATMQVNIDPDYARAWSDGLISDSNDIGMQTDLLCAKCHDLRDGSTWGNVVHEEHDDRGWTEGSRCVSCHVGIPHGWSRPRLLGSQNDPAPYATVSGGLIDFALKDYSPYGWEKSDCDASCTGDRHPPQGNPWPGTVLPPPDSGTLSGRVTDEGGAGVDGALVDVDGGPSTLTDSAGYYTITDVTVGNHSVTASKIGYIAQTKSAVVFKDLTTTLDFTLAPAPLVGTVTGTVTNAFGGAPIEGADVDLGNGMSTTTAADGTYSFFDVDPGTWSLDVAAIGYEPHSGSVDVVAWTTTTADVSLTPLAGQTVLFSDGFESGDFRYWRDVRYWTITNTEYSGSRGARMSRAYRDTYLEARVNTSGYDELTLTFWLKGSSNTESADYVRVQFRDDRDDWHTVWTKTLEDRNFRWAEQTIVIPESEYGPFGSDTRFRISARVSASNEYQYIDDVELSGW
jgi:hypothetical protein